MFSNPPRLTRVRQAAANRRNAPESRGKKGSRLPATIPSPGHLDLSDRPEHSRDRLLEGIPVGGEHHGIGGGSKRRRFPLRVDGIAADHVLENPAGPALIRADSPLGGAASGPLFG